MKSAQITAESRHQYLPTDNIGLLYCWQCWDALQKESPRLSGHHGAETCDACGKTITPDKSPLWTLRRQPT